MLDLNRLRVLHEVAGAGSFSAAARALHITPSAVAQQIGALERSVGVPVVHRSPRGVQLTEPGRLLADTTAGVFADLNQVGRKLDSYAEGAVGRLVVATFPSAGQRLIPGALTPLTTRPEVELDIREAETQDALPLVRDGEVDLAIVYHFLTERPPHEWSDLDYTPLLSEETYAVLPAQHELADRSEIPLSALAEDRWIHAVRHYGVQLETICLAAGFRPVSACRTSDHAFMQSLVAGGVGVALAPALTLVPDLDGVRVVRVLPTPRRQVGVVRRRARWHPPLANELVDRLLGVARALSESNAAIAAPPAPAQ